MMPKWIHAMVNEYKDHYKLAERYLVNFSCTDDGDTMSVAPRSDSSFLAVRDGMGEGKHNSVTPTLNC